MSDNDDTTIGEPTGEMPVVSATDSRVTVTGAEVAAEVVDELYEDVPLIDEATLLPHWTDAPTGQVPIVVAREAADSDDPWAAVPAPAWREGEADWVAHEDQFDASFLAGAAKEEDDSRPWEFVAVEEGPVEEEIQPEAPRPEPGRANRTRRTVSQNPLAGRAVRQSAPSSISMATLTGVILAAIVTGVFLAGTLPVAILLLVALGLAAAEAYAAFRAVGAHPATILGIVGVLTLGVAVYNKGESAFGAITVLMLIFGFIWYLTAQQKIDVLDGLGATIFVYVWIGVLGCYSLLLISPNTFAHRHGLAYLFGAIILAIANDTGALFIGRWLGSHPLNPSLSPNKTIEGTIGGTIITLAAGLAILPRIHPWTMTHGLEAAVALAIVLPLGDLFESMVKRTLGVKDLGRLLPGHGGLTDRIDGLLFAMPTMFYLVHVLKLG